MEDQRKKTNHWSVIEVQTFLWVVAEDHIQKELDGATRNEKVFQEVAQLMTAQGYHRTSQQCRDKLKKLKSNYRQVKDHNNRSGSNRKAWKWFDQMDAIYGHRLANQGNGLDTATSSLEAIENDSVCASDEWSLFQEDTTILREMLASDERHHQGILAQRERHFQIVMDEARKTRQQELAMRREEATRADAFNQALLGVLGQIAQAIAGRNAVHPPQ